VRGASGTSGGDQHAIQVTSRLGIRSIALFRAAKAFVAIAAATGLVLQQRIQPMINGLAGHLHLNPAHDRLLAIVHTLEADASTHLKLLALGAGTYAAMRLLEAVGLWHPRNWAIWFGVVSAAVYLPFEIVALVKHPDMLTTSPLCLNGGVTIYLAHRVSARRAEA
jgi:uncharacterized membrane protein (DUF2068 family)